MIIVGTRTLININGNGHLPVKSHGFNSMSVWFMIEVSHVMRQGNDDILHLSLQMISDNDVSPYIIQIEI